ncbi:MAG: helix-hairpin-helix domain-containing protein [Anaerolineae bacterium]|nr:helix-hairpin-helix domain-containing protein [Anaerolineae bacterium]MDW8067620.1 helix-hairpin-helix domain-containing protein [Anaerolineae bacterium]
MTAPTLATPIGSIILWLVIIFLLILFVLYLVWLFTRQRERRVIPPAEAAHPSSPTPSVEPAQPAAMLAEAVPPSPAAPAEAVPPSLAPPAEAVAETVAAPTPAEAPADDLTRIEGIGPKVAKVLASIGITTFQALATADYSQVKQALVNAGWPYMDPTGWMEQAKLAAEGRWEELALLQEQLKGGRRRR